MKRHSSDLLRGKKIANDDGFRPPDGLSRGASRIFASLQKFWSGDQSGGPDRWAIAKAFWLFDERTLDWHTRELEACRLITLHSTYLRRTSGLVQRVEYWEGPLAPNCSFRNLWWHPWRMVQQERLAPFCPHFLDKRIKAGCFHFLSILLGLTETSDGRNAPSVDIWEQVGGRGCDATIRRHAQTAVDIGAFDVWRTEKSRIALGDGPITYRRTTGLSLGLQAFTRIPRHDDTLRDLTRIPRADDSVGDLGGAS